MATRFATILLVLAGLQGTDSLRPINAGAPITVCQVLQDLPTYSGKIVEIRGDWNVGSLTLAAECPMQLQDRQRTWPNAISLEMPRRQIWDHFPPPGATFTPLAPPAIWNTEQELDYQRAEREFFRLFFNGSGGPIMATIVGRVDVERRTDGSLLGYSVQNIYPARVFILSVKDVTHPSGQPSAQTAGKVPTAPVPPYSVCQVLSDFARYRGKTIEVRGEWSLWSTAILKGDCSPLKTGSFTWPNGIALDLPNSSIVQKEQPADWTFTYSDFEKQTISIAAGLHKQLGAKALVTVVGRLDLRVPSEYNEAFPKGYGPSDAFPARLVILAIKDVAYVPREPADQQEKRR